MSEDTTANTSAGNETNTVINPEADAPAPQQTEQTPDQFYNPEEELDVEQDPAHYTTGMSTLGYTEASRIEDTTAAEEAEREAAMKAAEPAEKSTKK